MVVKYALSMFTRRGELINDLETILRKQLGSFVRRAGGSTVFADYWAMKGVSWPQLAHFATAIGEAAISEAAVERGFSAQAHIFNELRVRMGEESTEAQLWLAMNYDKIKRQSRYAERVEAQQRQVAKRRAAQEKITEELAAKRARK